MEIAREKALAADTVLDRVVADRERHSDALDRSIRGAQALLQRFGL